MNLYKFYHKPEELNGYEDRVYFIPGLAYDAIMENPNREDRARIEQSISKDAMWSYEYAKTILKGPFPKGEGAIATNAYYSYHYSRYVLKGRFPKGETAIKNSIYDLYYIV